MNKFAKAIAAIMLTIVAIIVTSCNKPDEPNNGGSGNDQNDSIVDNSGTLNGYDYVDLGLPSGTLWATCNVGAETPEDYGDYFAWGETLPKNSYWWNTYQYCIGDEGWNALLTKYCNRTSFGYNDFSDSLTTLLPEDDAATANWGADWRIPTKEEWQELYNNTNWTWMMQNNEMKGLLFTATNGNTLLLPCAGYFDGSILANAGGVGNYWSSSLDLDSPSGAWYFQFDGGGYNMYGYYPRCLGRSVRPICSAK